MLIPSLKEKVQALYVEPLETINEYVSSPPSSHTPKLPVGLITTDTAASSNELLFNRIRETIETDSSNAFCLLRPTDCSNLKNFLKTLIYTLTKSDSDGDNDELNEKPRNGSRLLNYDLQILADWRKSTEVDRVVVAIPNSESLDSYVLNDALNLLR